jgi:sialidase-1
VNVTAPAGAEGAQRLQAAFTAADGRVSQTTASLTLPLTPAMGATLTATNTSPARDVVASPYQAGDQLSFTVRVAATSNIVTTVTPDANTFTTGFSPTACRWQNLAAGGAYNCTTPRRTLTQADIDRGWYTPEFSFRITAADGSLSPVTVSFSGASVPLRDGVLGASIEGGRTDTARDLAAQPYAVGEQVPYAFRVDNSSPVTVAVVPTAGEFAPFLPPGAGNCRYLTLAADAGYDCTTPKHAVTTEDIASGFFVADTTWTVSAAGQTTKTIEVAGGEVDVIERDPRLAVSASGVWHDADGDGYAAVGDTVTWTREVRNTGNVTLTDVVVGGSEFGTLASGESAELEAETVVLTAQDVAAGSVAVPSVEASASNGERNAEASVAAAIVTLPAAAEWKSSAVYLAGNRVSYDGGLWEASWWTSAQRPGDPYGPWQEIAVDSDGRTVWTASRIFDTGDVVVYNGTEYTAKWWTRNQQPDGSPWGPWEVRP